MVDRVHACEIVGVEGLVALLHEGEQVCSPVGVECGDVHNGSFSDHFFASYIERGHSSDEMLLFFNHLFKISLEFFSVTAGSPR